VVRVPFGGRGRSRWCRGRKGPYVKAGKRQIVKKTNSLRGEKLWPRNSAKTAKKNQNLGKARSKERDHPLQRGRENLGKENGAGKCMKSKREPEKKKKCGLGVLKSGSTGRWVGNVLKQQSTS